MKKMKTKFTLLAVLVALFCTSQGQQITNSDFENWYATDSIDMPIGWSVVSNVIGYPFSVEPLKDSDAYSGNYCLRLLRSAQCSVTASCGFSLAYHPVALHGLFNGTPYTYDTFKVNVRLYHQNQAADSYWV